MWIHLPLSMFSQSAPGTEASSLESMPHWLEELAQSATWKTKSVRPASLRSLWKRNSLIRHLSGLTYEPSTLSRGVERFISLLGGSPVSHIPRRAPNYRTKTPENYLEKSSESQPDSGLPTQLSFLKMSPESLDSTGIAYDPNYERWVTALRRDSSRRQKQGHRTFGNVSSSWPTPNAQQFDGDAQWQERRDKEKAKGRNGNGFGLTLGQATSTWPTPQVGGQGGRHGTVHQSGPREGKPRSRDLTSEVDNWPTPNASGGTHMGITEETAWKEQERGNQIGLGAAAVMWPTPTISPGSTSITNETAKKEQERGNQVTLGVRAVLWPTPLSRDYKDGTTPSDRDTLGTQAPTLVNSSSIPRAQEMSKDGHTCSQKCQRLSPRFVEKMMGLPLGWTDDSDYLGMESFLSWQKQLSLYLVTD